MNDRQWLLSAFFISGFAALIYEIAYANALELIIGVTGYVYAIILAVFLLGLGLGSLAVKKFIDRTNLMPFFAYIEMGIGLYALIFIPIVNQLSAVYVWIYNFSFPSFFVFNALIVLLSFSILIIPALLMGATFPVISRLLAKAESIGTDTGTVFALNTLGGMFGAFAAGFVFFPAFSLEKTIFLAAMINLFVSLAMFLKFKSQFNKSVYAVTICIILICSVFLFNIKVDPYQVGIYYRAKMHPDLENYQMSLEKRKSGLNILFSGYGIYGSVIVTENNGDKVLLIKGKADASTSNDMPSQLLASYIPLMLHSSPKEIAVIGLGSGVTVGAAENFNVSGIDLFEIDPLVVEASRMFNEENHNALSDKRVNLMLADARNYLFASDKKYDIIISEPSNPWFGNEGFLFTKEFFEIVRRRLNEGGIFAQWAGVYDFNPDDLKIFLNTIAHVFPYVQVWSSPVGEDFFIIASAKEFTYDYAHVKKHFQNREIYDDFELMVNLSQRDISVGPDLFFSFFVAGKEFVNEYTIQTKTINTDNKPVIEFETAKNRIRGQSNVFIDILNRTANGSDRAVLIPEVVGLVPAERGYSEFLRLHSDKIDLTKLNYYYNYIYFFMPGEESGLDLVLNKLAVAEDSEKVLFIYVYPGFSSLSKEEISAIALSFGADVTSEFKDKDVIKYRIRSDSVAGFIWHCPSESTLYLAYFESKTSVLENPQELEKQLVGLQC